eukprot:4745856-Karenia_brevis.AAC.1
MMDKHVEKKIQLLQRSNNPDMNVLKNVLAIRPDNAHLVFAATWFGQAPLREKIQYVLSSVDRFSLLEKWDAGSKWAILWKVVDPLVVWQDQGYSD